MIDTPRASARSAEQLSRRSPRHCPVRAFQSGLASVEQDDGGQGTSPGPSIVPTDGPRGAAAGVRRWATLRRRWLRWATKVAACNGAVGRAVQTVLVSWPWASDAPWIPEPGLWMQWGCGCSGAVASGRSWRAAGRCCSARGWRGPRFRMVLALRDKALPSVVRVAPPLAQEQQQDRAARPECNPHISCLLGRPA